MLADGMPLPRRELLTCKLLWSCIPEASLDSYEGRPSGKRFAAFYDAMVARFRAHTSGVMGDQRVKCFLDLMVYSQVVPDHHLDPLAHIVPRLRRWSR